MQLMLRTAISAKVKIIQALEDIAFDVSIKPNYGRLKALELLGRHHGMFLDKVQHSTDGSFTFKIIKPDRGGG